MKAPEELVRSIRASGLIPPRSRGVVMVSGGPDSACLAAGLAAVVGPDAIDAIHVNYRLRPDSDEDEAVARELCGRLLVDLRVERPTLHGGNVQAAARDARYEAAERMRRRWGGDWIATGHSRTDLAETMLYRLAASPGRRAMLGMSPRRGRLIRPLLAIGRDRLRALAEEAGLPFRDDPSNLDLRFARNRIRAEVLPALKSISPDVERNLAATWREIAEESEALESLARAAVSPRDPGAAPVAALKELHPGIRRIAFRMMAESVAQQTVPVGIGKAEEIWRLAQRPEGGVVQLHGGVSAVCESGWVVFSESAAVAGTTPEPEREVRQERWAPARLHLPGTCTWGGWELNAEIRPGRPGRAEGPDVAMLDADALGSELTVRGWREGDRISPLGLEGSKSLQDLFTDRKVPRSHRPLLPVLVAGDRIAWVAGVAVGEEFKLGPQSERTAVFTATPRRS